MFRKSLVILFTVQLVKNGGPSFLTGVKSFASYWCKARLNCGDFLKNRILQPTNNHFLGPQKIFLCDTQRLSYKIWGTKHVKAIWRPELLYVRIIGNKYIFHLNVPLQIGKGVHCTGAGMSE